MQYIHAIGRRKTSIARVYLSQGSGAIKINDRTFEDYFPLEIKRIVLQEPLKVTASEGQFDIKVNVKGGGVNGQCEAIRLGITRALVKFNAELKPLLKEKDLTTRNPKMVERKKFGKKKARKSFQFSKR
jgi:small subunit ribosomal protein S9